MSPSSTVVEPELTSHNPSSSTGTGLGESPVSAIETKDKISLCPPSTPAMGPGQFTQALSQLEQDSMLVRWASSIKRADLATAEIVLSAAQDQTQPTRTK